MRYFLNGRPLHELEIERIIEIASAPGHQRHHETGKGDYWRNRDLLQAFGDETVRTSEYLAAEFHKARGDWSSHFNAQRCGETLQWAIDHGIVERIGARPTPRWRLLRGKPQFELVGAEKKQRAIRVRGLTGAAATAAATLWDREQKRRERARLRRLAQHKSNIAEWLRVIVRHAPETPLDGPLARFAIADHQTLIAVEDLILGSVDDMALGMAMSIDTHLSKIRWQIAHEIRTSPPVPPPPAADLEILGGLQL